MARLASAICVVLCELVDFLLAFCNAVVIALSVAAAIVIAALKFVDVDSLLQIDKSLLQYLDAKLKQNATAITLLILSIIVIVIYPAVTSCAGYAARKRQSAPLMTCYFALLSLPWIGLICLQVMLVSRTAVMQASLQLMQESLNDEFLDVWTDDRESHENFMSVTWNAWMVKYDCCAMNGWNDFNRTNWARQRNESYAKFNATYSNDLHIPIACCKVAKSFASGPTTAARQMVFESCQMNPENSELSNGLNGCKQHLQSLLNQVFDFFQSLLSTAIAATTILWVAALVVVAYYWRKAKHKLNNNNNNDRRPESILQEIEEHSTKI